MTRKQCSRFAYTLGIHTISPHPKMPKEYAYPLRQIWPPKSATNEDWKKKTAGNSMFLQWCRDELHLSFIFVQRFRFVGQDAASKRHHCRNTNVVHKAAKGAPETGTVSVYYACTTGQVEWKNKFGPRALVITRGQIVLGDKPASRGHTAGWGGPVKPDSYIVRFPKHILFKTEDG